MERTDLVPKTHIEKTRRIRPRHTGWKPTCDVCKVSATIAETTILKKLEEGLRDNGFLIVKDPKAKLHGTPHGMLNHLIKTLRLKGIKVT